jgi:hypothetical protein
LAGASPLFAQKTDKLVLKRGDEITGEVKELNRGKLSYKTDDMGTLSVEWDKVAHLTSTNFFDVENARGVRYFGRLGASEEPGELLIVLSDTVRVRMMNDLAHPGQLLQSPGRLRGSGVRLPEGQSQPPAQR